MRSNQTGYINNRLVIRRSHSATSLPVSSWAKKIKAGDIGWLSRAITLIESTLEIDRKKAEQLLDRCTPTSGKTLRLGITGPPGAGKSSFIEYIGNELIGLGSGKIAVLSIDPSSPGTGGSILGDKTRMQSLAQQPTVYIRPSPSKNHTGGVHQHTRESIQLCEYAGFEIILVETVGVGQSELTVNDLTDLTILLLPPAGGDELQGLKKGITEMADLIIVNKNDSGLESQAKYTQAQYQSAVHLRSGKKIKVYTCSSLMKSGFEPIWKQIQSQVFERKKNGQWKQNRARQRITWFTNHVQLEWMKELNRFQTLKNLMIIQKKVKQNHSQIDSLARQYLTKLKKMAFKEKN